jgi:myo-inositol-1-phosphate synthase
VKSPAETELFKITAPETPLVPTPVITRRGTRFNDSVYYAENLKIFCSVVNEFDGDDASSITLLQDIFQDSNELKVLKTYLAYSHANVSFLSQSITKLEMKTNSLSETMKEINDVQNKLKKPTAQKLMQ